MIDLDLLDDDMESFLTAYSAYLCNTIIPTNHKRLINNPEVVPTSFVNYSGLKEYLNKEINLLRELAENEFYRGRNLFERECKRAQAKKHDTFGQESKIGLSRKARWDDINSVPHSLAIPRQL